MATFIFWFTNWSCRSMLLIHIEGSTGGLPGLNPTTAATLATSTRFFLALRLKLWPPRFSAFRYLRAASIERSRSPA